MKTFLMAYVLTAVVAALFAGCTSVELPGPKESNVPSTGQKAQPKSDWDALVEAARKEGSVVIYANGPPKLRDDISSAFAPVLQYRHPLSR